MQSNQRQVQVKNQQPVSIINGKKQDEISEDKSSQNLPQKQHKKDIRRKRYHSNKNDTIIKVKYLHWTPEENLLYKKFLKKNRHLLEEDFYLRRVNKINVLMSQYIKTKTSHQCRSHHQKMMIRHKNVIGIIKFIEKLKNVNPPRQIMLKSQGQELHCKIQDYSNQPMNKKPIKQESLEMPWTQPKIKLVSTVEFFLQQINQLQIQINVLKCYLQNILNSPYPNEQRNGSKM